MLITQFTLGDIGRRYGLPIWKVRRVFERGFLPEPARVGAYRVLTEDDIPDLERALVQLGYLDSEDADHVA